MNETFFQFRHFFYCTFLCRRQNRIKKILHSLSFASRDNRVTIQEAIQFSKECNHSIEVNAKCEKTKSDESAKESEQREKPQ